MLVNKDSQQSNPVVVEVPPPKQEAMDVDQAVEEESSVAKASCDQPNISSSLRTDNQCQNQLSKNSASQPTRTDTPPSVSAIKVRCDFRHNLSVHFFTSNLSNLYFQSLLPISVLLTIKNQW